MRSTRNVAAATVLAVACLLVRCASAPAPPEAPPEPIVVSAEPAAAAPENPVGTVKVTATTLNVRSEPRADATIVSQVRRGDRLGLIRSERGWSRVRVASGAIGWVSAQHVAAIKGCPPDSDFRFTRTPTPSFSDSGAHGLVVIEAAIDTKGVVTSARLISNSTSDASLAAVAEREIRGARFVAPVRNCVPRAFIYAYKRSF